MKTSPVVYLSAHGLDVVSTTRRVRDALEARGLTVVQESLPVRTKSQCRRTYAPVLNRCHTVVQIVGRDAGPALAVDDEDDALWSVSRWEAHEARRLHKPVNCILLADDFPFDEDAGSLPRRQALKMERKQQGYRRKLATQAPQVHDHEQLIRELVALFAGPGPADGTTSVVRPSASAPDIEGAATAPAKVENAGPLELADDIRTSVVADVETTALSTVEAVAAPAAVIPPPVEEAITVEPPPPILGSTGPVPSLVEEPLPDANAAAVPEPLTGRYRMPMKMEFTRVAPVHRQPVVRRTMRTLPKTGKPTILVRTREAPPRPGPMTADLVAPAVSDSDGPVLDEMAGPPWPAPVPAVSKEAPALEAGGETPLAAPPRQGPSRGDTVRGEGACEVMEHLVWPAETPSRHQEVRMSSFWITDAMPVNRGSDVPTHIRTTLFLVATSICISILLLCHAAWEHYGPKGTAAVVAERVPFRPVAPPMLDQAANRPPEQSTPRALQAAPVAAPTPLAGAAAAPLVSSYRASEAQQGVLEKELESATLTRRASTVSPATYLQMHGKELMGLKRRLQAFKLQLAASEPVSSPRMLQVSRDIACLHLLSMEFQTAQNVLLDTRDAASRAYGVKHEEIRLLDHLLAQTEVLRGVNGPAVKKPQDVSAPPAGKPSREEYLALPVEGPLARKDTAGGRSDDAASSIPAPIPMTPQEMEKLLVEMKNTPESPALRAGLTAN